MIRFADYSSLTLQFKTIHVSSLNPVQISYGAKTNQIPIVISYCCSTIRMEESIKLLTTKIVN